jgi:hypothetical protein
MKKKFNVIRQIENKTVLNNTNGEWLLLVHQFRFFVLKFPFNFNKNGLSIYSESTQSV